MQRKDPRVWSVHFRGQCYQVPRVALQVVAETVYNDDGRQPWAKFVGLAQAVDILDDGGAVIW